MEICRRNGLCISVDVLGTGEIEFSYYITGNKGQDDFYVASASKYEQSVIIHKEVREKFLDELVEKSDFIAKKKFETRESILDAIRLRFELVDSFEDIISFLNAHGIDHEVKKWVEFYD